MIANYDIDYVVRPSHNARIDSYRSNDPVAAEDFLVGLVASGAAIKSIKHEGVELSQHQSDKMVKIAAERLISSLLGRSLALDAAQVKHRFGFAA
jgi:hypothetical protein